MKKWMPDYAADFNALPNGTHTITYDGFVRNAEASVRINGRYASQGNSNNGYTWSPVAKGDIVIIANANADESTLLFHGRWA